MLDFKIKELFFDRPAVQQAVDAAKRRVMTKAGAYIRTAARTSIRKRKGTSEPGSPPYSHEGSLRKFILFGYDPASSSVVVGPVAMKEGTAPNALEFGGSAVVKNRRNRKRRAAIRRRPFMGPAMQQELPKFPELWRNSIVRS